MEEAVKNDYGYIFWLHVVIIFFWYSSPFLFSWYWLIIGIIFSYLQGLLINGCVLTHFQFGKDNNETFWGYYLRKIGIGINKKVAKIVFFWIEPLAVLLIALFLQVFLNFKPVLF